MGNTQVESRFADQRTYYFGNKEIDRQVHLGFDLASVQHAPVHASNTGKVVFAEVNAYWRPLPPERRRPTGDAHAAAI